MRLFILFTAGLLLTITLSAQTFSGRIADTQGKPVPNATIYIRETAHGIMANEEGEFRIEIEKGDYTCEVSSLGYDRKTIPVSVPKEGLNLNIELVEKTYAIREVTVTPDKEDPAYRIMRHVIARAPYHLHQVKKYESGVYIKGSFKVDKVPALIKSQIKDPEFRNIIGKLLLYESQSEVKYSQPDQYEQRVIAVNSSIPQGLNISDNLPFSVITNNIYTPTAFSGLLGPGSFSVYKFKLEDWYDEGGHLINKIRVTPRKRNGQLVTGWLYIVDGTWTVQQADLTLSQVGTTVNYHLTYHEVQPGAFLPTSYDMSVKLDLMGMKGSGQFYSSIKYNSLETNAAYLSAKTDAASGTAPASATTPAAKPTASAATQPTASAPKELTKKQQKAIEKIEELSNKDNLTTREAYKMAQLVQKTVESDELKEQRRSLELRPLDSLIIVTRDSLAFSRDSSFWSKTRTLPLQQEELTSYLQRDSIRHVTDSMRSIDSVKNRTFGRWVGKILLGEELNTGKKTYFKYDGLLLACTEYNFVDGFKIGQRLETGIRFDDNRSLSIAPAVYYTTARKKADFLINGTLTYAPMRNGNLSVSAGNTLADYADRNGTGRLGNALASLIFAGNTAKFYQKKFASVSNRIDVANGLILTTGFDYEKRNDLENNTSYHFFGGKPKSNRPHGQADPMPGHDAFVANITLQYTPRLYYSVWNGRKVYRSTDFPTIALHYRKGFAGNSDRNASFDRLEAAIFQNVRTNLFSSLFYEVNAGAFLSSDRIYLPDFKHFRTNEMFLSGKSLNNSFFMDNYSYATDDKWLQAHVTYASNYLILKQIPFLQSYLFDEALHIHTLWTPAINHNEVGYSIGFGGLGRIGISVCFDKLEYKTTGFTISLPLMNLLNR